MKTFFLTIAILCVCMQVSQASPLSASVAMQVQLAKDAVEKEDMKKMSKENTIRQANDLEAVLIAKMIEPLFPEGKDSMLFGGGNGSDIYRHMMIDEYGKILQKSGGLGIAKNIAKDLSK